MNTIEGMIQLSQVLEAAQGEGPAKIDSKPTEEPSPQNRARPPRSSRKLLAVIVGIAGRCSFWLGRSPAGPVTNVDLLFSSPSSI
jgi:hypothetical protein